jgi:hypothetical protein
MTRRSMPRMTRSRAPAEGGPVLRGSVLRGPVLAALVLAAVIPVACSTPAASDDAGFPTSRPTTSAAVEPASEAPTPSLPSQSETGWGTIWDAVPAGFPVPDGAEPTAPAEGPASGAWVVPVTASNAPELAGFYQSALDHVGWGTGIDGPLEDGSFTVWSSNGGGCDTLTTILPRGDESLVTVLFGAGCRFE